MVHNVFVERLSEVSETIGLKLFQDIIGRIDVELFTGAGVKEYQDFKREVLEKGLPAKRAITFETELFGSKTFFIYVEQVFGKQGRQFVLMYLYLNV